MQGCCGVRPTASNGRLAAISLEPRNSFLSPPTLPLLAWKGMGELAHLGASLARAPVLTPSSGFGRLAGRARKRS